MLTGNKVKIGNLKPTREYNYIEDTVNAFKQAIDNKKIIGDVVNIGNGYNISVKELGTQISNILNKEIKFDIDKSRIRKPKTEVKDLKADNSKAKKILKWTPKFSGKAGLNKGLKKTINWFLDPKNLLKYKKNIYNI